LLLCCRSGTTPRSDHRSLCLQQVAARVPATIATQEPVNTAGKANSSSYRCDAPLPMQAHGLPFSPLTFAQQSSDGVGGASTSCLAGFAPGCCLSIVIS
jgi:hypothetical protein